MINEWLLCAKVNNIEEIKDKIDLVIKNNNITSSVEYKSTKGDKSSQFDLLNYATEFKEVVESIK
jgi:hypothetical protein